MEESYRYLSFLANLSYSLYYVPYKNLFISISAPSPGKPRMPTIKALSTFTPRHIPTPLSRKLDTIIAPAPTKEFIIILKTDFMGFKKETNTTKKAITETAI